MSTKWLLVNFLTLLWVVVYGGFSFAEDKSKYRYPDLDTPFIAEFRERYEANPKEKWYFTMEAVLACANGKRYNLICGQKDIDSMKALAEKGDHFSLAVLSMGYFHRENNKYYEKLALDNNETVITTSLFSKSKQFANIDYLEVKQKLDYLVSRKEYAGFVMGLDFLFYSHEMDEFCELARKTYEIFGLEAVGRFLVLDDNESAAFLKCGVFLQNQDQELILHNMGGEESMLLLAYRSIHKSKIEEAKKYLIVLSKSNNKIIRANAEYCLGIMWYYGKGFKLDKKHGAAMIEAAYNEGIIRAMKHLQDKPAKNLPKNKLVLTFGPNTCDELMY